MKIYNFLSVLFLLCSSAKAQELALTNEDALSALQKVVPILNQYTLITDGEKWFLSEQEAVSAIIEHNRTADLKNKIISDASYGRKYRLIPGLPANPDSVYGEEWFSMKERIASTFLKDVGPLRNVRGNKVLRDGYWRFLTEQEAVSAINKHNQTADPENKIISDKSYRKNYRLIPGLPQHLFPDGHDWYYPSKKRIPPQIIGWVGYDHSRGNKVLRNGRWRFLTEQEAVYAINKHNRTADPENKIISDKSYRKNYRLIPGLPNAFSRYFIGYNYHSEEYYLNKRRVTSQIIGWVASSRDKFIKISEDERFLTELEAVSAIIEHNKTAPAENKILSTLSYQENYGLIPRLPQNLWTHYGLNKLRLRWMFEEILIAHYKDRRCTTQFITP